MPGAVTPGASVEPAAAYQVKGSASLHGKMAPSE